MGFELSIMHDLVIQSFPAPDVESLFGTKPPRERGNLAMRSELSVLLIPDSGGGVHGVAPTKSPSPTRARQLA